MNENLRFSQRINVVKKIDSVEAEELKQLLNQRAEEETIPNFLYSVKQINDNVNLALETQDKDEIKKYLKNIKRNDNYLSEKYRDTKEQRAYSEGVERIICFLEDKIKALKLNN